MCHVRILTQNSYGVHIREHESPAVFIIPPLKQMIHTSIFFPFPFLFRLLSFPLSFLFSFRFLFPILFIFLSSSLSFLSFPFPFSYSLFPFSLFPFPFSPFLSFLYLLISSSLSNQDLTPKFSRKPR